MAKFKLVDSLEFWWPVRVKQPSQTRPGGWDESTISCKFKRIPKDRMKDLSDQFASLQTDEEREHHQDDLLREAILDWKEGDMVDEAGNPVPFSSEMLEAAISDPAFKLAAYKHYIRAVSGGAVEGN